MPHLEVATSFSSHPLLAMRTSFHDHFESPFVMQSNCQKEKKNSAKVFWGLIFFSPCFKDIRHHHCCYYSLSLSLLSLSLSLSCTPPCLTMVSILQMRTYIYIYTFEKNWCFAAPREWQQHQPSKKEEVRIVASRRKVHLRQAERKNHHGNSTDK